MALFDKQKTLTAWKSDIIEKLSKITSTVNKTNFHDATETLEGSIKIYSTRVENVCSETNKLVESVNLEHRKDRKKKKKVIFLEKETQNKKSPFYSFKKKLDILSKYLVENKSLLSEFKGYDEEGMNLFENVSVFLESETKSDFSDVNLVRPITPSAVNLEILATRDEINPLDIDVDIENEIAIEREAEFFDESSEKETEIEINPFVYKGWGGPQFWKMKQKKIKEKKEKLQKQVIDLNQEFNLKQCFDYGDVFFSKETLNERKKTTYYLPEDELQAGADLFSFNYLPGYFIKKRLKKSFEQKERSFSFHESINEVFDDQLDIHIQPNEIDDVEGEINNEMDEEQQILAKTLMAKYTKVPKKIDMHRLKENMYETIEKKQKDLDKIMKSLDQKYDIIERKDISKHYCFISLLHLANEKGINLESDGKNVKIKF